jgi:hypothetical protein
VTNSAPSFARVWKAEHVRLWARQLGSPLDAGTCPRHYLISAIAASGTTAFG